MMLPSRLTEWQPPQPDGLLGVCGTMNGQRLARAEQQPVRPAQRRGPVVEPACHRRRRDETVSVLDVATGPPIPSVAATVMATSRPLFRAASSSQAARGIS